MSGPQDPSHLVAPQLLPHVHLISRLPLPRRRPLEIQEALEYLIQAPTVFKEGTPMQWQYIQPPDDGVMFLTWQPPSRGMNFPSDGFVWIDMERGFEKDIGGYVLEIMIHQAGFVPGRDQMTCHSRWRYRIRNKLATIPGEIVPQLWLVQYRPAEPAYTMLALDVQPNPEVQRMLTERRWLEAQGAIQQKQFMFFDRPSWPHVTIPQVARRMPAAANAAMQQANAVGAHRQGPGMAPHPQFYPGGQQPVTGPPAKRARQVGPAHMPTGVRPAPPVLPHDQELEEAEDTTAGDFLDYITPATISRMRFKQHHVWIEEVFSSIYAMGHIIPEELGFGLVGELGELTKGILNPPSMDMIRALEANLILKGQSNKPLPPLDTRSLYRKLTPEQLADFEKRVAEFVDRKQKEMQEMKAHHQKVMARVNKGKIYLDAEERLREAGTDPEKIEAIVREVELSMGISLQERKDVVCVQKGGLQDEEEKQQMNESAAGSNGASDGQFGGMDADDTAAGLLDEFTSTADFTNTMPQDDKAPVPGHTSEQTGHALLETTLEAADGMDLDTEINLPEELADESDPKVDDDWVHVENKDPSPMAAPATTAGLDTPTDAKQHSESHNDDTGDVEDVLHPESMFDGADFSAFDGLEGSGGFDSAGDDLLNFEGSFGGSAEGGS